MRYLPFWPFAPVILLVLLATSFPADTIGEDLGTVRGAVTYRKDSQRPWRYARYYVGRKLELAEAVVALRLPRGKKGPSGGGRIVEVDQKNFQFTPETVAVQAGDKIKFLNSDNAVHNVKTSHPRQSFNINLPAGGIHVETFPKASGIVSPYKIGCVFHSSMRCWIYVFDHPFYQVTGKDGRFELKGVPAGKYRLELIHPAGGLKWSKSITVKAGSTSTVDIQLTPDEKKLSL